MNVSAVLTKYYENARLRRCAENKPKQSQRTLIAAPDRDTSGFVIFIYQPANSFGVDMKKLMDEYGKNSFQGRFFY